jgi:hypothetical protein
MVSGSNVVRSNDLGQGTRACNTHKNGNWFLKTHICVFSALITFSIGFKAIEGEHVVQYQDLQGSEQLFFSLFLDISLQYLDFHKVQTMLDDQYELKINQ